MRHDRKTMYWFYKRKIDNLTFPYFSILCGTEQSIITAFCQTHKLILAFKKKMFICKNLLTSQPHQLKEQIVCMIHLCSLFSHPSYLSWNGKLWKYGCLFPHLFHQLPVAEMQSSGQKLKQLGAFRNEVVVGSVAPYWRRVWMESITRMTTRTR